jgi:hypothetical protein
VLESFSLPQRSEFLPQFDEIISEKKIQFSSTCLFKRFFFSISTLLYRCYHNLKFHEYNPSENTGTLNYVVGKYFPTLFLHLFCLFQSNSVSFETEKVCMLNSKRQLTCVLLFAIVNRVHTHSL